MLLTTIVSFDQTETPLELVDLPIPEPSDGEIQIRVSACGVCHTELDEIEGRTAPPHLPVVPGHQVVGRVAALGSGVTRFRAGDRVGVGWIHSSTGAVDENVANEFRATGRDVNGGYAEYMTVGETYAYPIPDVYGDAEAAPLLCAGAVGYRALKLANLRDGQALGLTGFGGSNHLVLQLARYRFPASPMFVFARDRIQQQFAIELGAAWAGDPSDRAATARRNHRYHASLEADRRCASQPTPRRPTGDQRDSQGRPRQGGSPVAHLPRSPLDGTGNQERRQRHALRSGRIPPAGGVGQHPPLGNDLPAGSCEPRLSRA